MGIAIALIFLSYFVSARHNPQPLVLAIPTSTGETVSPQFTVDQTLRYLVELEVDRTLPFEQLNCLLGETSLTDQQECEGTANVVNLNWQVTSNGTHIASGQSSPNQGAGFGPTITKTIGAFEAISGKSYTLKVHVLDDMGALKLASPRMVVQLHPIDTKGNFVASALLQFAAVLLAVIAVLWLAINAFRAVASRGDA